MCLPSEGTNGRHAHHTAPPFDPMTAINLSVDRRERALLELLDGLIRPDAARAAIAPIVAGVESRLAADGAAVMAWEPVPLKIYQAELPPEILSSWVFILRAGTTTGAERHPNSRQRVMSYAGCGDLQTRADGDWQSHLLTSDENKPIEDRWLSIPANVWHQAVVPDMNWVVVSFHTVPADELIEERPSADHPELTQRRMYLTPFEQIDRLTDAQVEDLHRLYQNEW